MELRARLETTVDRELLELRESQWQARLEELEAALAEARRRWSRPGRRATIRGSARIAELEAELAAERARSRSFRANETSWSGSEGAED